MIVLPLLLSAAASAAAHSHSVPGRKSLAFGPTTGGVFTTTPPAIPQSLLPLKCPHAISKLYARDVLGLNETDFYVRKDSYHDKTTGVHHIYLRQILNGIEVSDANVNINIRDGQVISYGDSVRVPLSQ